MLSPVETLAREHGAMKRGPRTAFWATLTLGMLTYLMLYTNTIFVHDSIHAFDLQEETVRLGRWLIRPLVGLRYGLQLPVVIGASALCALFVTVTGVCKVLEIHSTLGVWLTAAVIVTAPAVADTHVYYFTVDLYMLALALATLSVLALRRWKRWGWLTAAALLCLSMGIYQSYLCWASTLMLLALLRSATEESSKTLLRDGLKALGALALATAAYMLIANAVLRLEGAEWSSYQNLGHATDGLTLPAALGWLGDAYADVLDAFFGTPYGYKPLILRVFRIGAVALALLGTGLSLRRRPAGCWALCAVAALLLPLSMNAMDVLNRDEVAHSLMKLAYVAPYLLLVAHIEQTFREIELRPGPALGWLGVGCLAPVLLGNWILANSVYTNLKLAYDRSLLMANRIVAAVEQTADYAADTPVLFVGFFGDNVPDATEGFEMNHAFNVGAREWAFTRQDNFLVLLREEMGVALNVQDASRAAEPAVAAAVAEMPCYPESGYIRRVGDTLVVKLGET